MAELFLEEIKLHRQSEELKQELESIKGYAKEACYYTIDDCRIGAIHKKNLERFFNSQRRKTSEMDYMAIIRRIDLDADSKIKLEEFCEAIRA